MASADAHDSRVDLLGTVQMRHTHVTASRCQMVLAQTSTTGRVRSSTLAAHLYGTALHSRGSCLKA
jgi:hypothetical protein